MNRLLSAFFCTLFFVSFSQDQLDKIDVLSYDMLIEVSDDDDTIYIEEVVTIKLIKDLENFYLDLISVTNGRGMKITSLLNADKSTISFNHKDDKIVIVPSVKTAGTEITLTLKYHGVPQTGLIIGKNKFGDRTFFGDNWPNRARHWIACVDHPSDKATVKFNVVAPKHYDCIATGTFSGCKKYGKKKCKHTYQSDLQLPTKVMVIGLAEFEIEKLKNKFDVDLSIWTYTEDAKNGLIDMACAEDATNYFVENIGPYPFEKLANVQSTTQFGGMENAGNIFYDEGSVKGENGMEKTVAHEIAHQWFGNSASEADWQHIWLSEGFATYMTDLYWENKYGTPAMNERLIGERERVIKFSKQYNHPVVDTTYASLMDLLNPHSYQKGAWFLHMLRNEVSDSVFWKGVRTYYEKYQFGNATTADFQEIMQSLTFFDLDPFFNQWLYQSGQPRLKFLFNSNENNDVLSVFQLQNSYLFDFNLEVELIYGDGTTEIKTFKVTRKKSVFILPDDKVVTAMKFDPNVKLLYEREEN